MSRHTQTLEQMARELQSQNAEWDRVVETLKSFDPEALLAANPALLDEIEEVCRVPSATPPVAQLNGLRG